VRQAASAVLLLPEISSVQVRPYAVLVEDAAEDAFERRAVWLRGLTATDKKQQLQQMTSLWWKFGLWR